MKCHIPGTAWQNACSRPSGSISAEGVVSKTTPLVPTVSPMMPGLTQPPTPSLCRLIATTCHDGSASSQSGSIRGSWG